MDEECNECIIAISNQKGNPYLFSVANRKLMLFPHLVLSNYVMDHRPQYPMDKQEYLKNFLQFYIFDCKALSSKWASYHDRLGFPDEHGLLIVISFLLDL